MFSTEELEELKQFDDLVDREDLKFCDYKISDEIDRILFYDVNEERKNAKRKAYLKEYYAANKERRKAYNRAYYEANKERLKACNRAYREVNKERIKAYSKAYNRAYYEVNKERIKAYSKAYYEAKRYKRNSSQSD